MTVVQNLKREVSTCAKALRRGKAWCEAEHGERAGVIYSLTYLRKKTTFIQHSIRSRETQWSDLLTLHEHNSHTRFLMGRTPLSVLKFGSTQFSAQTKPWPAAMAETKRLRSALEPGQDTPPLSLSFFICATAVTICN